LPSARSEIGSCLFRFSSDHEVGVVGAHDGFWSREHAGGEGSQIDIKNPSPDVKKILDVANFGKLFEIN
jgi:hypothetical protein